MAIGLVGTWFVLFVPLYGLPLFAILATALVLRGPRAAFGGAILFMTGLWFTYLDLSMKARCAEMNHNGGFCQVMNPTESAVPGLLFVMVGAALSSYALLGKRSPRAGE